MVNISGRSKGCSTCRRRRVKCDESRPVCKRCQRWDFECDGPRDTTFVHTEPLTSSGLSGKQKKPNATDHSSAQPRPQTAPSAVGFDVYICYTRESLQRGGLIVSAISNIKALDVFPTETTVASRRVSHQAILSFATILFGLQHQQTDIARHGYALYSVALTQLNQSLASTMQHTSDEVIMAVATLAISELLVPSGKNNYLMHMMGLQRLLELQEPDKFWPRNPYGFRNGVRFMILFASMKLKNPCILARPEWKRALRVGCSPKELQEQDLYDALADCTVLLAKCECLLACWDVDVIESRQQAREVENRGHALLAQLRAWRRGWDADRANLNFGMSAAFPRFGLTRSPTASVGIPAVLAATEALNSSTAVELMLFDVTLACILQVLASLPYQTLPQSPILRDASTVEDVFGPAKEYYASQERLAALEACRCVRSYVEERHCIDPGAPQITHWAIAMAWGKLRDDKSVEAAWLTELLTMKGRQIAAGGLWTTYKWLNSLPE